jgi:hypothetical protein
MIPVLLLGLAFADSPNTRVANKATAALDRTGPHMARFAKVVDGQPEETVLEIFYYDEDEVSIRVFGGGVEAVFAIDQTHARIRVSDKCAVVPLESLQQTVPSTEGQEPLKAMLDYRLTPGGEVNMNIVFQPTPLTTPFGWLADMGDEDATVSKEGPLWRVEKDNIQWWVSRKTGVLERMVVEDGSGGPPHTVEQIAVESIPPQALAEATQCPNSSDELTTAMFTVQLLWEAYGQTLPSRLEEWSGLDPAMKEETIQQQRRFWRRYFAEETTSWVDAIQRDQVWATQIISGVGDIHAFESFEARLAPDQHEQAVQKWLELWFTTTGQTMLDEYIRTTENMLYQRIAADQVQVDDPSIIAIYIVQPMAQEARLAGEEALLPVLQSVIQRGKAYLDTQTHQH